ncbi:MAG TPA: substrate-binding domain-containing protein [Pseudobacteroides sp.]|uniref:sugar ABC transporter substrate-binding protein n=1 Tax=Pseudobacteroides sp. TaxID=1968840 RepID=UPI002F931161
MAKRYIFLLIILVLSVISISAGTLYSVKTKSEGRPFDFKYTFAFIPQQKHDPFWKEVRVGVEEVAKKENISLQVMESDWTDEEAELDFFNIAILSKVDGIIAHSYDKPQFIDVINKAENEGIPVITIDTDCPLSNRSAYVGIDYKYAGERAAEAVTQSMSANAHIAILSPDTGDGSRTDGFLEKVTSSPGIGITASVKTSSNILEARSAIRKLLVKHPDINYVFCTNYNDTIGAAREIVDLNKSERIKIIGSDYVLKDSINYEMETYIKTGTILANVIQDPYSIGKNAMSKMINHKKGKLEKPEEEGFDFVYTEFSE